MRNLQGGFARFSDYTFSTKPNRTATSKTRDNVFTDKINEGIFGV